MSAFCAHAQVEREGSAEGVLAGLSFAVKDVFAVEGVASCCGNPRWLEEHPPASRNARSVQQLLDAGARLTGLTITDELALSLSGENAHYGTPINPRCPERVPGGSSSGSAVAVASEQVDFALGTDTGGSVRVPASHTGLFGFRPSHGAVSLDGVLPLAPRFDTVGWFARDAALLERVGAVLLPPLPERAGPAALVLWRDLADYLDDDARAPFARCAAALARALHLPLIEATAPEPERWLDAYLTLQNLEAAAHHRDFVSRHRASFGPLIGRRLDAVLATPPEHAARAEATRTALIADLAAALAGGAWLVLPSAPGAAPLRGLPDDTVDAFTARALTLAAIASLCGAPQLTLPLVQSSGCPLGVSLLAARGADHALLAFTQRLTPACQESS